MITPAARTSSAAPDASGIADHWSERVESADWATGHRTGGLDRPPPNGGARPAFAIPGRAALRAARPGHRHSPAHLSCSILISSIPLPPFPMHRAFPDSEYYGGSAPVPGRSADDGPSPPTRRTRGKRAGHGRFPCSLRFARRREEPDSAPAASLQVRHRPSLQPPGHRLGIAAGRWTGPGRRSWMGCGPAVMRPKVRTGRSALSPRSPARTSTRPGPAASWPLMTVRGALANDRKSGREGLGRSRGGLTTKIHVAADLRCRPVARLTSPGQHGDSPRFIPLMEAITISRRGRGRPRQRPGRAMADKAYSSRANRTWLRRHQITAVIPVKEDQKKHRRDRGRARGRPPVFDAGCAASAC